MELTAVGDFLQPARSSVANCSRVEPCFLSTLGQFATSVPSFCFPAAQAGGQSREVRVVFASGSETLRTICNLPCSLNKLP